MADVILMEERSSKGIVHDYYTNISKINKGYNEPPYFYKTLMDMVEVDPILFNAISLTADLITKNGYDFIGKNKREIEKAVKLFNDELDFDRVIKNILWSLLVYGDSYLEIRWNETKTKVQELNPRETQDMVIDYDEHGEIKKYIEKIEGKGPEKWPVYEPDEMIHFRLYWVGSQIYSRSPFKAIAKDFATGLHARNYVQSVFTNLSPKTIYFLKNANKQQREQFIENLLQAKTNPSLDIIAQGEEFNSRDVLPVFDKGLIDILKWNQRRVLAITRVPAPWAGDLAESNRGIGENIIIPYETKIHTLQHEIASQVNRELMEKLKLPSVKFKWNAISLLNEKTVGDILNQLNNIGLDGESLIQYARDHGIKLRPDAKIEKPDPTPFGVGKDITSPSRMGKSPGQKMGSGLDKTGTSPEAGKKLEKKKVV